MDNNDLNNELKSLFDTFNKDQLHAVIIERTKDNNIEIIDYILNTPNLVNKIIPSEFSAVCLMDAAKRGYTEVIQYFLKNEMTKDFFNIHIFNESPLKKSCESGNLELASFILNLSKKDLAQPTKRNKSEYSMALAMACKANSIDIIKLFLEDEFFSKIVNIHHNNDAAFKLALDYNNNETIQYLIMDFNMSKTNEINQYLTEKHTEVIKMFEVRDLHDKINNETKSTSKVSEVKIKI